MYTHTYVQIIAMQLSQMHGNHAMKGIVHAFGSVFGRSRSDMHNLAASQRVISIQDVFEYTEMNHVASHNCY